MKMYNFLSNILLTIDNVVKLADFGTAKSLINTVGRTLAGSPAYMSPEQFNGRIFGDQEEYTVYKANTDIWFDIYFNKSIKFLLIYLSFLIIGLSVVFCLSSSI